MLPDFIIIGAQRSGTSSLYHCLCDHPEIYAGTKKEVHFFDLNYQKGADWYESHFPKGYTRLFYQKILNRTFVTGEASPYYLFHPFAAHRMYKLLPGVKLIIMLRNPIDRAYSHYWHEVERGTEHLPFDIAIDREPRRLSKCNQDFVKHGHSPDHWKYSYLSRGRYLEQLKKWNFFYPSDQFHVIKSEDFYTSSTQVLERIFKFLNLKTRTQKETPTLNRGEYPEISKEVRKELSDYFEPYNRQLYDYLERDLQWH